jgi:outer membrane protein assembly factor BamD (BamD/ComL family)
MKKNLALSVALVFAVLLCASAAFPQGAARNGPDPATIRDPELEKDSLHNLDVARQYFKLKKAYIAALRRCEEIIAGNPTFAKIDEALFIAGESSLRLSENKGNQAEKERTTEQLREDARTWLSQLVNEHPQSPFRQQAEDDLKPLGGVKPKTEEGIKP